MMSDCWSCACWQKLSCVLAQLGCYLHDSALLKILLAVVIALVVIININAGFALVQPGDRLYAAPRSNCGPAAGNNQSPINIESDCAENLDFCTPLMWSHYDDLPLGIRLENNGHTLLLRAAFDQRTPYVDGGDLLGRFDFHEIGFKWSFSNSTGSEHTLDHRHYPLEMQCLHTDSEAGGMASSQGLLMISYMFELSQDNPYLDVIINHLVAVQQAGQRIEIPPFPLRYLMPAFFTQFYSYRGSLTESPYHQGAEWFVYPVPLAIGERQLNEFRQLCNPNGVRIGCNARPVQQLNDRQVYLNRYMAVR